MILVEAERRTNERVVSGGLGWSRVVSVVGGRWSVVSVARWLGDT